MVLAEEAACEAPVGPIGTSRRWCEGRFDLGDPGGERRQHSGVAGGEEVGQVDADEFRLGEQNAGAEPADVHDRTRCRSWLPIGSSTVASTSSTAASSGCVATSTAGTRSHAGR